MSYPYMNIAKAVALRAEQLEGGDYAAREAAYAAASIVTHVDGIDVPFAALKHTILAVGAELAGLVGSSSNAIFRSALTAASWSFEDGDVLKLKNFVGEIEGFFDEDTDMPLTEGTLQQIDRYVADQQKPVPFWKINPFQFCVAGNVIRHTCEDVYARGCKWDPVAQAALFDAVKDCPLPAELEVLHWCKVLAVLPTETWFVEAGGYYGGLVQDKQAEIIDGRTKLLTAPSIPKKTVSADPTVD